MANNGLAWWNISKEKILAQFQVNPEKGLTNSQVRQYRAKFGPNSFARGKQKSIIALIIEGIKEPMMLLLLVVALLSTFFGKFAEAIAMVFVVLAYIGVELINKYRTDRTMQHLKVLATPTSKVMRNGTIAQIKTNDIVVGDILILQEGVFVPADARLLTSFGITINEASLTGESLPIRKDADVVIDKNAPLAERENCIFSGTIILDGQGTAVVFAVGKNSELGKIAQKTQATKKETTFLQESMTKFAKVLAIFALIASALIPTIGFLRGLGIHEMILTWLSLTFLMIPGQPPIIITMALALTAFALAKKQVIVKRLHGIEIIGQVTAVISDKTGTITESVMRLENFVLIDGHKTKKLSKEVQEKIALALPDYCNDPTDKAVFEQLTITKKGFIQNGFDGFSEKKLWRDISYKKDGNTIHAIAGAPEILISQSTLSLPQKDKIQDIAQQEAALGKRVAAYGYIENKQPSLENLADLTFIALAIIHDPVRSGVKEAIELLEKAYVKTFIVTGDRQETAQAIAAEIGVTGHVINGNEFDRMPDKALNDKFEHSTIFARMNPEQKLRLVKLMQQKGEITAVIGDGVNDAPALKAAHVGIAMGQIGTDLAKEVSDLILTDDNYAHIPDAIALGRKALDNFKKGLTYYLSAKSILLIIFLIPLFLGIAFPFAPIQIILIELLMDLASSTIFVTEQPEPGIMEKPAEKINNFFGKQLIFNIIKNSLGLSCGISLIYLSTYYAYNLTTAQTAAFVAWLLGHILLALNLKQTSMPLLVQGIFSNYFANFWLCSMILLSGCITLIKPLFPYLHTTNLPLIIWIEIVAIIIISTFWIECLKLLRLKKLNNN